ncbi:MFS transporter [Tsukamurella sp. 8F]|uniref:MFS transporter n=1 Tax=unclassified Tsukamurella TaxID=2633480 RepID=UPI0023B897FC|nr:MULTISPECIES: MFS transporter [unclassified Tsukamurella]MDF0530451.1 MFS transporter [Tsukamurella sp. 8J]MDF0587728.1 MFS transporter [Tsukamurella sp. 8F]
MTDLTRDRKLLHYAWIVAAVTFVAILGAAGFRSVPGVMMDPLHMEFGWSHATIGMAMSVNMALYGLTAPFAAALMDRLGIRPVVCGALVLIAAGTGLSTLMTASWQLILLWGVLVGLGTGSISMAVVATVATRWFVARRGLVTGVLTAASATGQLIFLPVVAMLTDRYGWRVATLLVTAVALAVAPIVAVAVRSFPADKGLPPYGATELVPRPVYQGGTARRAVAALFDAAHHRVFWLLAGSFAICGATTNGLLQTHFIPAAQDHGMPPTTAASLLALIGVFDVVGTIASGWFTDRLDSRVLLVVYYVGRGIALALLPSLLTGHATPSLWVFILFYGLDWVATVPPTIALCRKHFGEQTSVVFGWVFASHQVGAAVAAVGAGYIRDASGGYDPAFYTAAGLCVIAAGLCWAVPRVRRSTGEPQAVPVA